VADNLNEKQRSFGFAMQSMFIGLASFVAGYLPQKLVQWFNVSREKTSGAIPQNIMLSFYIGGAVFLIGVLYTVFKSKEYPPSDAAWKQKISAANTGVAGGFREIIDSIKHMPSQMKRLALVNFLTWPGLFLMWFYYSTGVATNIFGGHPVTNSQVYTQGLEYANTTSAILNLVTFAFSFTLPLWVGAIGKKYTHTICLIIGGIGLMAVKEIHTPWMLYVAMSMVGIAWASILSMPYSMLAGCLPENKIGIYMGIFNFFIVLPEILASLFFGKIMDNFLNNDRLLAVRVGGVLLCLAAIICALIIKETKDTEATAEVAAELEILEQRPV
ncbi:MAG TPA: MFS transporter, partial [Chitinophagaceae bacterium]|nr:MFS transporter [Chitinophagaceae bacterium]